MSGILKAGVVGAGVFGGYHAKKYVELDGVNLVGVFDVDLARAKALAESWARRRSTTWRRCWRGWT